MMVDRGVGVSSTICKGPICIRKLEGADCGVYEIFLVVPFFFKEKKIFMRHVRRWCGPVNGGASALQFSGRASEYCGRWVGGNCPLRRAGMGIHGNSVEPLSHLTGGGALDGKRVGYGGTGNGKIEEKLERSMR